MPLINTSLPNLIQGVSQQPDAVRYDGQCEVQENALSSVVDGLQKRPAAEFVFDAQKGTSHIIDEDLSENTFFHLYKRSDTERYCFTQDGDVLRIHNADTGEKCIITEQTTTDFTITDNEVNTSGTYLSSLTPKQNLKSLTIGDSTFLLNTSVATDNSTATISSDLNNGSLVFIKQGDYSKRYGIKINNITQQIFSRPTTPANNPKAGGNEDEGTATQSHMADSSRILDALKTRIAGSGSTYTQNNITFTVTQLGNLMYLKTTSSQAYTITAFDGLSGEGLGVVHREVSSLADLPTTAPHNYKVKVIGDAELNQDDFYCQFKLADNDNAADDTIGEGSWIECAGALVPTDIDESTMPRIFVSTDVNTFEIRRMSFDSLKSGDLDSNPYPSFLGNAINNLFQYKNRLGFLSLDSVIMSEAGFGGYDSVNKKQSYNFFRTTVTDLLDGDPIDVSVSSNDVTNLRSAQPFQENLIMFSENSQFVLKGGELLTPKSVSVTAVTNFNTVDTVDPIPLGSYLYFPFQRGGFSGLREFTVNANADVYDSNEITAHVPQYIPNNLTSLTGSNSEQIIAMTSGTTLSSAQNTADTSIVFNNYGVSKFVSSNSLVFHMSAYQTDAINYITDPTAIFSSTTNASRTYTLAKDATNSGYTMRGVLTTNNTTSSPYIDSINTTRQEVIVSTTRSDTSAFISDLPNLSNYNSFRTNSTSNSSTVGAQFLEFSEFYYPTKFSEFKNKFNDGDGYTIEWFGGIDERKYLNTGGEGVYLWSFTPQNTQRSSGTGDQREYLNVIESSLSNQRHKMSVGYDNGGSAANQTANLMTNFNGAIISHSVDIHRKNPINPAQPTAENGSFTPIHIVLTGDASNIQIYLNNNLVVDLNIPNSGAPTLSSILPNMSELKLTTGGTQIRPIYFRIYNEQLTAAQRQFNYNFRYASV